MELAVHSRCELAVPCKTDPYDSSVFLVTASLDKTLLHESVYRYSERSDRNAQYLRGLRHRSRLIGTDGVKSMHLGKRKVREVSLLQGFLFSNKHLLEDAYQILGHLLLKIVRIEPVQAGHASGVSAEELRNIAQHSSDDGTITKEQGTLLENVFQFSTLIAREIMVPRGKIDAISITDSIDDFLQMALTTGHSRYPVFRNDLDDITGIIHIKDVFSARQAGKSDITIESLLRGIVYIPETATVGHVLEKLQQKRSHLAVVVDEYGGTSGIITIEDTLERLVGNIEDEFDPEHHGNIEPHDDGWVVKGETLLNELTETLDVKEIEAESDTVSGFIMERLERVAKLHDIVSYQDLTYEVISMERLRIARVFVRKIPVNTPQDIS